MKNEINVNLLTLNTLSNENIESKEEVNKLLLQMALSIKKFLNYDEYKTSRFYTEEKIFLSLKLLRIIN